MKNILDFIPNDIYGIYRQRDDLQKIYPESEKWGVLAFFLWWKEHAELNEYNCFWLPSKKLRNLFYFSKEENGVLDIYLAIAYSNRHINFCASFLEKKDLKTTCYKEFKFWISYSYKIYYKNTYLIFQEIPGIKNLFLQNSDLNYADDYNKNIEERSYLSFLLKYLKLEDQESKYAKYIKKILYKKASLINPKILPIIFRNFYDIFQKSTSFYCPNRIYINYLYESVIGDIPRFLFEIFNNRNDLKDYFQKQNYSFEIYLLKWWLESGFQEYNFSWDINNLIRSIDYKEIDFLDNIIKEFLKISKEVSYLNISEHNFFTNELFFDKSNNKNKKLICKNNIDFSEAAISVSGFHNYQLGISEDTRNIYKSVKAITKNVKASNIPLTNSNKEIKVNYKIYDFIKSEKNIIVLPPQEQLNLFLENPIFFESKKVYALIPWELEKLPGFLNYIFEKIDTIFAPSKFIEKALSNIHEDVRLLPHYVDINIEINKKRFHEFTFLYSADMNSFISRKNPICVIKAFKKLINENFNKNKKKPLLYIRLSNFNQSFHHDILKEINNFEGINLIITDLNRQKYLELLSQSHCYISPHRSEGFGRNIAEAMYLGTPTIVSNYSGNLDFCNEDTSYLINGKIIKIKKDEYPLSAGCSWYDPNYEHLKDLMLEVFNNYEKAILKSIKARKYIEENHTINAYKRNLKKLIF